MAEASWELQKSLYSALSSDAVLTTLLNGSHVYDDVPQGTPFPYMTIGETTVRDWSTGTEPGSEHILTLHVWSRAKGRKQVHDILQAVKSVLHEASLSIVGHRLINLRHEFSDARRESDGETYHGLARYRAVTEPTP